MPVHRTEEKQISYWAGRKGFLEGRETVLFIHGAGGGQYTWSYQKGYFEKQFNPLVIELPGHGESGGEGEEEIGKYAEHVYAFLRALNLQKIFLVGHSMGGAIVQTLALTHPEVIKGIVLVGTGARLKVLPLILDGIKSHFEETVQRINRFAYSRKAPSDLVEKGVLGMRQCRAEVIYGDFLACDRFDMMNEIGKIILPTLILCGDDDQLTPLKYSRFLQNRINGSKLEVLSNAGHMVMMESASAFNKKIGEFIFDNLKGFEESSLPAGRQGFKGSSS
jgi:pimeloyl-ACP methyl ester carboxylesterase